MCNDIHPTAKIGLNTRIYNFVYIAENVEIGEHCLIANYVSINRNCKIGNNVKIQEKTFLPEETVICDDAWIGPCVAFGNEKFPIGKRRAGVTVGNRCIIGLGARILGGVNIGNYAVVAQASNVVKDVAPQTVVKGNPARLYCSRSTYDKKRAVWQKDEE